MNTINLIQIFGATLMLGGLARAGDATPSSVQVNDQPAMGAVDTKSASAPVTRLGVVVVEAPDDVLAQLPEGQPGALLVRYVSNDSPAQKAGLEVNDVLTRIDDQILIHGDELKAFIGSRKPGDQVQLTGYRHGKEIKLTSRLDSEVPPQDVQWGSVSTLPPGVQKVIIETESGKSPVMIVGLDGKVIKSGTFPAQLTGTFPAPLSAVITSGSYGVATLKLEQADASATPAGK